MKDQKIAELVTPLLASFGLDLDDVAVVSAGKRSVLRIVVDGDGPDGTGPLLDDIAEATKAISVGLDGSDATGKNAYTLEVSSRGVSRPLTLPRHWHRNAGRLVAITPTAGEAFTGRVVSSDDETVTVDLGGVDHGGAERTMGYGEIAKAVVLVEMNRASAKTKED